MKFTSVDLFEAYNTQNLKQNKIETNKSAYIQIKLWNLKKKYIFYLKFFQNAIFTEKVCKKKNRVSKFLAQIHYQKKGLTTRKRHLKLSTDFIEN